MAKIVEMSMPPNGGITEPVNSGRICQLAKAEKGCYTQLMLGNQAAHPNNYQIRINGDKK